MTQELEPIFTQAKGTYATGFNGQLFNYQTMKYNIIRQIIKNSIF